MAVSKSIKSIFLSVLAAALMVSSIIYSPSVRAESASAKGQSKGHYALAENWKTAVEGAAVTKPLIGPDGTVYVLTVKGKVYAFSGSGKVKWSQDVESTRASHGEYEPTQLVLGEDGTLYVGSGGTLHAIASDGKLRWTYETLLHYFNEVAVQRDGLIYIHQRNERVFFGLRKDGTKALERYDADYFIPFQKAGTEKAYLISHKLFYKYDSNKADTGGLLGAYTLEHEYTVEQLNTSGGSASKIKLNEGSMYGLPSTDPDGNLLLPIQAVAVGDSVDAFQSLWIRDGRRPSSIVVINNGVKQRIYSLTGRLSTPVVYDSERNAYMVTNDAVLTKFNAQGTLVWSKELDERKDILENGKTLLVEPDGSLLFHSQITKATRHKNGETSFSLEGHKLIVIDADGSKKMTKLMNVYVRDILFSGSDWLLIQEIMGVGLYNKQLEKVSEYPLSYTSYATATDSKSLYAATDNGRVIAIEVKPGAVKAEQFLALAFDYNVHELEEGFTYLIRVEATHQNGEKVLNPHGIVFHSSDERIAYFDENGLHAISPGVVDLSATYQDLRVAFSLTVVERKFDNAPPATRYEAKLNKGWEQTLPVPSVDPRDYYLNPAVAPDGQVYAVTNQGLLLAFDHNGTISWHTELKEAITAPPVSGPDGRLYLSTAKGALLVFDNKTGDKQSLANGADKSISAYMLGWNRAGVRFNGYSKETASIGGVRTYSSQISAADRSDKQLWSIEISGRLTHDHVVFSSSEDTLYVLADKEEALRASSGSSADDAHKIQYSAAVHAIDARNGELKWTKDLGKSLTRFGEPVVLSNGVIVAASRNDEIKALTPDGELKWQQKLRVNQLAGPVAFEEEALLVSYGGMNGTMESEQFVRYLNVMSEPVFAMADGDEIVVQFKDWLSSSGNKAKYKHSVAGYERDGRERWTIPLKGNQLIVSEMTKDYRLAVIDEENWRITRYDIAVVKFDPKPAIEVDYPAAAEFADLAGHWARQAVLELASIGVVQGFPDGTYRPGDSVTREQYLIMLARKLQVSSVNTAVSFADVPSSRWSSSAIHTAVALGWVKPEDYGARFRPELPVTREEMAVWTARALKLKPDLAGLDAIADKTSIQAANRGLIGAVVKRGIITGYPDKSFKPLLALNRAEVAAVLSRIEK